MGSEIYLKKIHNLKLKGKIINLICEDFFIAKDNINKIRKQDVGLKKARAMYTTEKGYVPKYIKEF